MTDSWSRLIVATVLAACPAVGRAAPISRLQLDQLKDGVGVARNDCGSVTSQAPKACDLVLINTSTSVAEGAFVVMLTNLPPGVSGADNAGVLDGQPYWIVWGDLVPRAEKRLTILLAGPVGKRLDFKPAAYRLLSGATNARRVRALRQPFTIAVLPDTQNYVTQDGRNGFEAQVEWILANRTSLAFVTHLGDVVDRHDDEAQWERAMRALRPLIAQSALPFSVVPGNHDGVESFRDHLPVERLRREPWFLDAAPGGLSHAEVLRIAGACFLHVALRFGPSDEELSWARGLLEARELRGLPAIVSTHDYLGIAGHTRNGLRIWERLVRSSPAIFMVLSGHVHPGERAVVEADDAQLPVLELLADYQDSPNGGNGLMRLVTLDVQHSSIDVRTWSPLPVGYDESRAKFHLDVPARVAEDRQ